MKEKYFEKYSKVFWLFILGSLIGFIHENLLMFFRGRYALRQGLIYEPLIPIYGLGVLAFYLVYKILNLNGKCKILNILKLFLICFLVGGALEYFCSFLQEKLFGTISWNYSRYAFNINGRTSLLHSIFWGLAGTIFYVIIFPFVNNFNFYFYF